MCVEKLPVFTLNRSLKSVTAVMLEKEDLDAVVTDHPDWHKSGRNKADAVKEKAFKSKRKVIWDEVERLGGGDTGVNALQARFESDDWVPREIGTNSPNYKRKTLSEFTEVIRKEKILRSER